MKGTRVLYMLASMMWLIASFSGRLISISVRSIGNLESSGIYLSHAAKTILYGVFSGPFGALNLVLSFFLYFILTIYFILKIFFERNILSKKGISIISNYPLFIIITTIIFLPILLFNINIEKPNPLLILFTALTFIFIAGIAFSIFTTHILKLIMIIDESSSKNNNIDISYIKILSLKVLLIFMIFLLFFMTCTGSLFIKSM